MERGTWPRSQYAVTPSLTLGAACEFAWLGDVSVNLERGQLNGRVAGDDKLTSMNFLALALS